ncbi:hypothetical protein Ccel_3016 [Ruminiclostridium cellulolyticum H10]|uniref:Uncharacterized protein n=1 Tax=Ruminiclostridium cellulolyticum (strain ATCC 35319 / DSM 5812 / JCM 6584 / H10) TaxID=394503 RepID=B8I8X7_RUMCH|nr:hypothetical protein Ccel_3016 [Ruminiclostridium cellulolyticum H10]
MRSRLFLFIQVLVFTLQLTGTALLNSGCYRLNDGNEAPTLILREISLIYLYLFMKNITGTTYL